MWDITEFPIIQAPMAGVQAGRLTKAVSDAGGLGSLPCALLSHDQLRAELELIRQGTSRRYNVNFFCHAEPARDPGREAAWLTRLEPYYRELGIAPDRSAAPAGRMAFDANALGVLREFTPPVVSFHFGLPSDDLLAPIRAWGGRILASATTVEEALWLESRGIDAIIAQGVEAGGHRGMFLSDDLTTQVTTLALVPQVVKRVRLPVIAAGGIADAAGVAAALRLGASAVQVGTAFLLCEEATTSPLHRAALASDQARHTVLTNVFTGRPARSIINRFVRELGAMHPDAPPFPLPSGPLLPLRAAAEARGSSDFSPLWAGQNADGCRHEPAAVLLRRLMP
jgi:nitronate monooxygenase